MAKSQPGWVVTDLMAFLGMDKETVETAIAPDLVNYTNETRLKSHLQDFLGPSPQAKAFTARYLAYRFPSVATSSHTPTPSHPEKPSRPNTGGKNTPLRSHKADDTLALDELSARFGPGGKVYQKSREDMIWSGASGGASGGSGGSSKPHAGGSGSGPGSGSNTPFGGRQAGAVTFNVNEPRQKRVGKSNGGGEKIWDVQKSREVRRLEGIIGDLRGLQNSEGKVRVDDDNEPCFCQARNHPLSRYTPHCPHCGLILCKLQKPHHPCPSCHRTLQTPAQLSRLIQQIESEVEAQLAHEQSQADQEERARLESVARASGGGSFPVLANSTPGSNLTTPQSHDTGRRVLTINSSQGKGKGKQPSATLTTTYSRPAPTPTPSRPGTPPPTDLVPRPRSPPLDHSRGEKDLNKLLSWREAEDRPWGDAKLVKKGGWTYQPPAVLELIEEDNIGRRRRKGRENAAKGMGVDGRKVVGAA